MLNTKYKKESLLKKVTRYLSFNIIELLSISLIVVFPRRNRIPVQVQNILVVELSMLGDIIMTTPLLAGIKDCFPHAKTVMVCTPWAKEAIINNPHIDEIYTYDAFWEDRSSDGKPRLKHLVSTLKLLRMFHHSNFEVSFVVTSRQQPFVPFLAFFSGAKVRIGTKYKLGNRFLTHLVEDSGKHMVEEKQRLLKTICPTNQKNYQMYYSISYEDRQTAIDFLNKAFENTKIAYVCITPSTYQKQKKWDIKSWITFINILNQEDIGVILGGGVEDVNYIKEIYSNVILHDLCKNVTGKFKLSQFTAIMEISKGLITVDSAPMHIASALRLPCVVLFGRAYDYNKFKPIHSFAKILFKEVDCDQCIKGCDNPKCMDFSIEEVYRATKSMLDKFN